MHARLAAAIGFAFATAAAPYAVAAESPLVRTTSSSSVRVSDYCSTKARAQVTASGGTMIIRDMGNKTTHYCAESLGTAKGEIPDNAAMEPKTSKN